MQPRVRPCSKAARGFAAERPTGRRYRPIAAGAGAQQQMRLAWSWAPAKVAQHGLLIFSSFNFHLFIFCCTVCRVCRTAVSAAKKLHHSLYTLNSEMHAFTRKLWLKRFVVNFRSVAKQNWKKRNIGVYGAFKAGSVIVGSGCDIRIQKLILVSQKNLFRALTTAVF